MNFEDSFWEQKGYDELRKLCRQGNEFCREVAGIFNERAKIEQGYAEGLTKLAAKAQKTAKDTFGTLKSAWESNIHELENEAEVHRQLGIQLHDEVSRQVKAFVETQTKTRKGVEVVVDKTLKIFSDKVNDAVKAKRNSYMKTKETEVMFEQLDEAKAGKGSKPLSEKEIAKVFGTLCLPLLNTRKVGNISGPIRCEETVMRTKTGKPQ